MNVTQVTNTIVMIEPTVFGYNSETAANNYFQQACRESDEAVQKQALIEFRGMVKQLREKGIHVLVYRDTDIPHTPDSIFPNNWISFHEDGRVVLYPMYAGNRRHERRMDIIQDITGKTSNSLELIDYSGYEQQGVYLEGTGSMILDRVHKIAYAALSDRTNHILFNTFCSDFGYQPVCFTAYQSVAGKRLPVYHTNVLLCVAEQFVVACLDSIDNENEKDQLTKAFRKTHKEIIEISETQMHHFAGNMLQVKNTTNENWLVMSETAHTSLLPEQITALQHYNQFLVCPVPTIEKHGGGSVRCMMLEVFGGKNGG